jgi:hypothetical protein
MPDIQKLEKFSVEELLAELRAREAKRSLTDLAGDLEPNAELQEFDSETLVKALKDNQKVIYGTDDRLDVFQINDQSILSDADSVVALFRANSVVDNGNGTSTLRTQNFATSNNLCPGEPFRDQPTGAFCSGFLVAPDIIATAGHCVNSSNVTNIRFVFGFRMLNASTAQTVISNTEIYRGVNLIGRQEVDDGADWALVRIDRPVLNHRIAQIRRTGKITDNQAVHVIGHPSGLPTKVAGNATVRNNTPSAFFVANLDTYGGNSGSPVFNSNTHEVEGVLVRGETDFVRNGTCNVSLVCPSTGCRGEDCTRTTEFAGLVPSGEGEGEFYTTDGAGNLSLLKHYTGFRTTWQAIVPGNFGGNGFTDLLFYDPTTGEGEFYTTDGAGNLSLLKHYTGFRTTWQAIVPGNFGGNGYTDLLFYDPTTGEGEFYTTDGAGNLSLLKNYTGFRTTWQAIVPGNFGGNGYTDLLFYDPTTGEGEFYTTDGAGNLSLLKHYTGFRITWQAIVPGNFGGNGYTDLLFYDPTV